MQQDFTEFYDLYVVQEEKDREYADKVELNRAHANEVTAKKRAKRCLGCGLPYKWRITTSNTTVGV